MKKFAAFFIFATFAFAVDAAKSKKTSKKKTTVKTQVKKKSSSSSTAARKKAEPEAPRASAPTIAPTTGRTKSSPRGPSFSNNKALIMDGKYAQVLTNLGSAMDADSRSLRAVAFEKLGFAHAALYELVGAYAASPSRTLANRAGGLAFLLGDSQLLEGIPADSVGVRLARAQDALVAGNLQEAVKILPSTSAILGMQPSPFKARALLVGSAIHNAAGNSRAALELLGDVFPETEGVDLAEIRLQRALVLFDIKRYSDALDELVFITRASPTWYRGQTVGAWASFHVEDYNLALGQLMNLRSPFLIGKFNPEKFLLQSVVLYQLCHYEAAARSLKKLKEEYGNMSPAFSRIAIIAGNPSRLYKDLRAFAIGRLKTDSTAVDRVWDGVLAQPYVANISRSLEKLDFERKNVDQRFRAKEFQEIRSNLLKFFERLEDSYEYKLANYTKSLVEKMKNDLKETMEGALAVDLEINTRIRDRLIKASAPVQKRVDFEKEVKKGYEFWPFQGEFWRDETGGYAYATTDICEEGAR